MSKSKKPLCYQCQERRAVPLTATRDGYVYENAQNVVMFCSFRCAANYGLLWGAPAIVENEHFCKESDRWEMRPAFQCSHCR
jgi:hypothetical protein